MIAVDIINRTIRWEFETGGIVRSSPVIVGSAVIFGSEDGSLYALDSATGEKLWDFPTGGKVVSSPTFSNGVVYVTSHDGNLYAIE
jgi:outer membrane protein assembly factor BamB